MLDISQLIVIFLYEIMICKKKGQLLAVQIKFFICYLPLITNKY